MSNGRTEGNQASEPIRERITVQQLIDRVNLAARCMSAKNPNRVLMLNLGRAIVELTERLDAAERELARYHEAEADQRKLIVLPGGR